MKAKFLKSFSAALFLSGSGTNAEVLLRDIFSNPEDQPWIPAVLVTDRPETSSARKLAEEYSLPLIEHDILRFYQQNGCGRVTIATEEGMRIRELWTEELRRKLAPYSIDFGILAGFMTLCNITKDFPCLNVHPGDLTVVENGKRLFAGLHLGPMETAILRGYPDFRSSVIAAQGVSIGGNEMDEGPVLGVSDPVPIDLRGHTPEELKEVHALRQGKKRSEYKNDILARIAEENVNALKEQGDWQLFPRVVRDYAERRFNWNENTLTYNGKAVRTVCYPKDRQPEPWYL